MHPTTALAFMLCGLAMLLLSTKQNSLIKIGKLLSILPGVIGLIRMLNDIVGVDISIDIVLFNSLLTQESTGSVARMAPNTAFNLILASVAIITLNNETSIRKRILAQVISLILFLAAWLSVLFYLYQVERPDGSILTKIPMAPLSACCFLFLAFAILFARPDKGLMKEVSGELSGSIMARFLIPGAILVPSVLGYIRLLGGWRGLYSVEFGVAILVLTIILFFLAMTWGIVVLLNRRDLARQQVEKLVREQDALVQGIFQTSPDGLLLLKEDGTIKLANAQCGRIFGYQRDELIGKPMDILIPERFKKSHPNKTKLFFQERHARPMGNGLELYGQRKDATEFPIEISLTKMESSEGVLVSAAIRDVTERKQADDKMRFLADIASNIHDAIITSNNNFEITSWNDDAEQLLEWNRLEVTGKKAADFLTLTYDNTSNKKVLANLLRTGYWQGEIMCHTKSGKPVYVLASVSAMGDGMGKVTGYLLLARDISERKKNEALILESEQRFSKLFYQSPVMSTIFDPASGTFLDANTAFADFLERPQAEVIGKTSTELGFVMTEHERKRSLNALQSVGHTKEVEVQIIVANGKKKWASVNSTKVNLGGRECFLSAALDITEKKRVEGELALLNKELEQRVHDRSKELIESEAFNRGVLNSLGAHVAVIEGSGKIVAVNEAWNRFSQQNGETVLQRTGVGSNYFSVCEQAEKMGDVIATQVIHGLKDVRDGRTQEFIVEYPCHSPEDERWFSMRATRFGQEQTMVVITHSDVTQRKEVEMKIVENEQRFRSIYETSLDAILLTKTDGTILSANAAACKLFGRSEEEIIQLGRSALVDHSDERVAAGFAHRQKTGRVHGIWRHFRKDGSKFFGEVSSVVFKSSSGEERASVFIRDLTDRMSMESLLFEKNNSFNFLSRTVPHRLLCLIGICGIS